LLSGAIVLITVFAFFIVRWFDALKQNAGV